MNRTGESTGYTQLKGYDRNNGTEAREERLPIGFIHHALELVQIRSIMPQRNFRWLIFPLRSMIMRV